MDEFQPLSNKEWATVRDGYILRKHIEVEDWERLSPIQKTVINEVKKTFNNNKQEQ